IASWQDEFPGIVDLPEAICDFLFGPVLEVKAGKHRRGASFDLFRYHLDSIEPSLILPAGGVYSEEHGNTGLIVLYHEASELIRFAIAYRLHGRDKVFPGCPGLDRTGFTAGCKHHTRQRQHGNGTAI